MSDGESILQTLTGALRPLRRAALGLGSNIGERLENLQAGVDALLDSPEIEAYGVSPVYETAPVGGVDQPDFLNAVVVVDTTLDPQQLLERAHAVEEALGRDRSREQRWGPRTLDIDVLAVGDLVVAGPIGSSGTGGAVDDDVVLPHPRLHERAFVLVPWADVDPSFLVPQQGSVREILAGVDATGARRRADLVLALS